MSGRITNQVIEEVRARVGIVELIGSRMTLKKAGSSFKGCCPFHREKTPSFHVNPVKQFYHCFGCGENGDVFSFLMKQDGLTFQDAVRTLAERVGVAITEEVDYNAKGREMLLAIHAERRRSTSVASPKPAKQKRRASISPTASSPQRSLNASASATRRDGAQRAAEMGAETQLHAGAACRRWCPLATQQTDRPDDYYDRFRGRLMFPICDRRGAWWPSVRASST